MLFIPVSAFADGKAFPSYQYDPASVTMPDQRAIIAFDEGVQTLAIETSITGLGQDSTDATSSPPNAAWIVPLPAAPAIEAGTPGLFPTTERVFADPVRRSDSVPLDAVLWIVLVVLAVAVLDQARSRPGRVTFRLAVFIGILLIVMPILLPALGRARGIRDQSAVRVLARDVISGLDVATLEAESPDDLLAWLDENGFAYDETIRPVVDAYLTEGWVFVAAKLAVPDDGASGRPPETITPMPLIFRFPTESPVYPMRLTGVGNGPLEVELFIFGDQRAAAPGFEVTACAETIFPAFDADGHAEGFSPVRGYAGPELVIAHPGLRAIVGDLPFGTRLVGTLTPEQMTADVPIGWEPFRPIRRMPYTNDDVKRLSWRWGFSASAAALLTAYLIRRRTDRARWFVVGPAVCGIAGVTAAVPWAVVPRVEGEGGHGMSAIRARSVHHFTATAVAEAMRSAEWGGLERTPDESDISWARRVARAAIAEEQGVFRGSPPQEADVPWGYTVRGGESGPEYVWYGTFGQEIMLPLGD